MELFKANRQWATRPPDERFPNLTELYKATKGYADSAFQRAYKWSDLRTVARDGEVCLTRGRTDTNGNGMDARLTHWSFGQLAQRVSAPADYLRTLPPALAAENLNHGLTEGKADAKHDAQILFHTNGSLLVRSVMTAVYQRVWNYEVAERLLDLEPLGWEPAVPDIRVKDPKGETALYASDHDMFAFIRNPDVTIEEKGATGAMYRGVIVWNSEVGDSKLGLMGFLYREMCGNHIIWGASNVLELSVRHMGDVRATMAKWAYEIKKYADSSASDQEAKIAQAQKMIIAETKEAMLDRLFRDRRLGLGKKVLEASYAAINPEQDGNPLSVWGIVNGITRYSQTLKFTDERNDLDRKAGQLLAMSF